MIANTFGDEVACATARERSARENAPRRADPAHLEDCSVGRLGAVRQVRRGRRASYALARDAKCVDARGSPRRRRWRTTRTSPRTRWRTGAPRGLSEDRGSLATARSAAQARWPGTWRRSYGAASAAETQNEQNGQTMATMSPVTECMRAPPARDEIEVYTPRGGSRCRCRQNSDRWRELLQESVRCWTRTTLRAGLVLMRKDQLRASSRLCVGDVEATPTLESLVLVA